MVNIKINFNNLISSDLGNVCPKYTSGRTSFENKLRIFTYNMYIYIIFIIIYYIYIQNNANVIYIHLYIIVLSQYVVTIGIPL